ncbi:hypothetical protein FHS92_002796 [Sphingobium subterraneum]|uniref:Uncharacterized protein n=2 Tax=Sphingobium subterraneum TaxID=627688 RepID=A0A841J1I7_9SPHN|nr:hypothetical protein [Sphingobium subterraneum]
MFMRPVQRAKRALALAALLAIVAFGSPARAQQDTTGCRDAGGALQPCPSAQELQRLREIVEEHQRAHRKSTSAEELSQAINAGSASAALAAPDGDPFGSRIKLAPADGAAETALTEARARNEARQALELERKSEGLTGEIARHWRDGQWSALAGAMLRAGLIFVACVAALGVLVGLVTWGYEIATSRTRTGPATPEGAPGAARPPAPSYALRRAGALVAVAVFAGLLYAGLTAINRSSHAPETSAPKSTTPITALPALSPAAAPKPSLREIMTGGEPADKLRRFVVPNRPDVLFAGKGRLIEISVPSDSKAVARFQWVLEPGHDIFIDFYALERWAKGAVIDDVLKDPENIAKRLGWLRLPNEEVDLEIAAITEGNSYYHLFTAAQAYGTDSTHDFGCTAALDATPAIVSVRLSGAALRSASQVSKERLNWVCANDMSMVRKALSSVGVGYTAADEAVP